MIKKDTDLTYYDLKEVSEILKVTNRTLLTYIKQGRLRAVKLGKKWVVTPDAIKDLLNDK